MYLAQTAKQVPIYLPASAGIKHWMLIIFMPGIMWERLDGF